MKTILLSAALCCFVGELASHTAYAAKDDAGKKKKDGESTEET